MKDHEIRETVSHVQDLCFQFRDSQQLRERIANFLVPKLKGALAPSDAAQAPIYQAHFSHGWLDVDPKDYEGLTGDKRIVYAALADTTETALPVAWRYQTPTGWHATTDSAAATRVADHHEVQPLYAAPVAPAAAPSEWQSGTPPVPEGKCWEFIIAVRRAQSKPPGKVAVFSANYANNFTQDGELSDRDGEEFIADGWYVCGLDMSGEYNEIYEPIGLNEGDEIVGWQELPKWNDAAAADVSQGAAQ